MFQISRFVFFSDSIPRSRDEPRVQVLGVIRGWRKVLARLEIRVCFVSIFQKVFRFISPGGVNSGCYR